MEHHFNVQIAQQFGLEEAIIVHNLFHWISKNAANGENLFEGLYWTYNSIKAYSVLFPYLSETKVKRVFKNLEDNGVIIKGNFSDDKCVRTNWYSFPSETLNYLQSVGYDVHWLKTDCSIGSKCTNGEGQNDTMILINYTDGIPSGKTKEEDTNVSPKKVDYQALLNYYNEHLTGKLPRAQKLSKQRIQFINARLKEYDMETIYAVIDKCVQSSFLTGQKGDWHANFDWILLPTNFLKILEGNYDTDLCNCEESLPKSDDMVINGQIYR